MGILKRLNFWFKSSLPQKKARPGARRSISDFETLIDYRFKDYSLINHALKHRSIIAETGEPRNDANERLEFLGDAVLDLVVSELLYEQYPDGREGLLARIKSLVVSGKQLASKAEKIDLGSFIQMSLGEARNGGRKRLSILEDAAEAVIGAIYLDGGLEPARKFILQFIANKIDEPYIFAREQNFKSLLLEFAQGHAMGTPRYRVLSEEGPDHAKTFHIEVLVGDDSVGTGTGPSKKQAEQQAAKDAASHYGLKLIEE